MNTWELSNKFVAKLESECKTSEGHTSYPALCGALQASLSTIFIELSVCHPKAFQAVLEYCKLIDEKEAVHAGTE